MDYERLVKKVFMFEVIDIGEEVSPNGYGLPK